MKIHILGAEQATKHIPLKKTYALRIFSGNPKFDSDYGNLVYHKNYSFDTIKKYYFDDIQPKTDDEVDEGCGEDLYPLSPETGLEILKDFKEHKNSIEELLVHCREGKSRSPAVAIALNEIFNLGENSQRLRKQYPDMNKFVYDVLMHQGRYFKR